MSSKFYTCRIEARNSFPPPVELHANYNTVPLATLRASTMLRRVFLVLRYGADYDMDVSCL